MRLIALIALSVLAGCVQVPSGATPEVRGLFEIARSLDFVAVVILLGLLFGGFHK